MTLHRPLGTWLLSFTDGSRFLGIGNTGIFVAAKTQLQSPFSITQCASGIKSMVTWNRSPMRTGNNWAPLCRVRTGAGSVQQAIGAEENKIK